jgi:hypothetical protein
MRANNAQPPHMAGGRVRAPASSADGHGVKYENNNNSDSNSDSNSNSNDDGNNFRNQVVESERPARLTAEMRAKPTNYFTNVPECAPPALGQKRPSNRA